MTRNRRSHRKPKSVLRLPDLALSKSAVLNSLASQSSHRTYDHAIDEFIDWYCSEPRLAFSRVVVLRYRMFLEQARYAPSTINLRLAAIRRLAFEASDTGLLSPDLAAGIARVKGVKRLGVRSGNWISAEEGKGLSLAAVPKRFAGSAIRPYLRYSSGAVCATRSSVILKLMICKFERITGSLPIWWGKVATSAQFLYQPG